MIKVQKVIHKNRSIINNIIGAFFVKGGSMIVSLFTMPAYINYFNDKKILGVWFTILSVLNWILTFDLGLGNGLRNKLPHALSNQDITKAKKYVSSTYGITIIFVIIIGSISFIVIPKLNWNIILNIDSNLVENRILVKCMKIVFIGILVQFILKLINSILYAVQKSAIVNFISLISSILILFMIIISPKLSLEENIIRMSYINAFCVNLPLLIVSIILFHSTLNNIKPNIMYFNNNYAKKVLGIGTILLWLQLVFMIISSTNEFLISKLTGPEYVVEYQAYNKIFNSASSLFVLALTPIWSAVTKAQAENNYIWIKKLYKVLLIFSGVVITLECFIIPFLQIIMNMWLGKNSINVIALYAIIFVLSNGIFIIHNVNTSICNGLSYFRVQSIWMTVAAIINIPLAYTFVSFTGSWIGVIIANILSLLPYEILQPIYFKKYIKDKK